MSKNIVLLSDGTGNSSAKIFKTNVWRLYQTLDLTRPEKQIAYYDDGVGTSSFKPLAILGGVFGVGLKRNVIDIYSFCCRNYQAGDKIYGFGFSRGAFTIRVVAGFIARVGLLRYNGNEADLARDAEIAYREYRKVRNFRSGGNLLIGPLRALRDWVSHFVFRKPAFSQLDLISLEKFDFLGVWDTVDAYGGPIEEITRAVDYWYWPLSMPDQFMNHKIVRACHALALEEERDAFRPVLWDDRYVRESDDKLYAVDHDWKPAPSDQTTPQAEIDRERISQVWFVGVHSDIGGGYSRDGLAHHALAWMMARAKVYGLECLLVQEDWFESFVDPYDKLNDSRHGLSGYYRYRPRKLAEIYSQPPYKLSIGEDIRHILNLLRGQPDPEHEVKADLAASQAYVERPAAKVHQSVMDRIRMGNDGYGPIVLPTKYRIVGHDGTIVPNTSVEPEAASRAIRQETVWDWVWGRRVIYFLTVFASLFLASFPVLEKWRPSRGPTSPAEIVVPIIDLVGAFLPSFVKPWLDAFRNAPGRFLFGVVLVGVLMYAGGWIQGHIRDLMRGIWRTPGAPAIAPGSIVYKLRSAGPYQAFFYLLKHWILPAIFALIIFLFLVAAVVTLVNRASFAVFDHIGQVCTPGENPPARPVTGIATAKFETNALCAPTGLAVEKNKSYRISLVVTDPWEDGHKFNETDPERAKGIETGPQGFGFEKMRPVMVLGLPIRRLLSSNWFAQIIRIGNKGFGEIVLSYERKEGPPPAATSYTATFRARRSGELFAYVNDTVIGIPGYFDYFYRLNNKGKADLTLELLPDK